jgi:hypothetical protein
VVHSNFNGGGNTFQGKVVFATLVGKRAAVLEPDGDGRCNDPCPSKVTPCYLICVPRNILEKRFIPENESEGIISGEA